MLEDAKKAVRLADRIMEKWAELVEKMGDDDLKMLKSRLGGIEGLKRLKERAGKKIEETDTVVRNLEFVGKDVIARVKEFEQVAALCRDILEEVPEEVTIARVRGALAPRPAAVSGQLVEECAQKLVAFGDFLSSQA